MDQVTELRTLYLDMVQRCIINTIYEDPNQGFWSPRVFDGKLRELGRDWPSKAHSMIGTLRMSNVRQITEFVVANHIPGDFIETGVWRGGACIMARAVFKAYGASDRRVWVADSFCGLPEPNPKYAADTNDKHHTYSELAISLEEVQANFAKYGLLDDQVAFLKGWFSETLPAAPIQRLAVLRLDGDMYESTMDGLTNLYDKVSPGGFVIVDDFGALKGCQQAIMEFRASRQIEDPMQNIDGIGVFWCKSATAKPVIAKSNVDAAGVTAFSSSGS
jgi:O-methyltransferase